MLGPGKGIVRVCNMKRSILSCTLIAVLLAAGGCASAPSVGDSSGTEKQKAAEQAATDQTSAQPAAPAPTDVPRYSGPIQFNDVTAPAGIRFNHNSAAVGKKYLRETLGAGCAFIDFDNDGWQDVMLINSTNWPGHAGPK